MIDVSTKVPIGNTVHTFLESLAGESRIQASIERLKDGSGINPSVKA
jgi:hypothetical protein